MEETQPMQQEDKRAIVSKQLSDAFSFDYNDFSKPIQWIDAIGVSRVKKYPDKHASLYKFGIINEEFQKDTTKKLMWVSVGYGREIAEGISYGDDRKDVSSPIDLDFSNEYFYDITSKKFYHNNREITPLEILKLVESEHIKPTKVVKGFYLRLRLWFWRKLLPTSIKLVDLIFVKTLWIISGEKIESSLMKRLVGIYHEKNREGIQPKAVKYEESEMIDFFGYKATRWSVVFYCALHLVILIIYVRGGFVYPWIKTILENNFLALCYIVVSFEVTEALIPITLKAIINKITPKALSTVSFKRLKI